MANYTEISCSTACNRVKGRFPFSWDMNIYRGCEHGCRYCFAMYSHQYLGSEEYFSDIFIKTNIVERLDMQLRSPSWKGEVVSIGGVTDSYQPVEARYKLMPEILRLMIKYKNPIIISTKSDLILRDFDLIAELAKITYVNVASTITCMDESIRRKLEPGGAEPMKRFEVLRAFSKTEASVGLHFMPITPYLTDSRENVEALFSNAKDCGVDYVLPGTLYLRGRTRLAFFDFIRKDYPLLYDQLCELYKSGGASPEYKERLYSMVNELRSKYKLSGNYMAIMNTKLKKSDYEQLSLFQ